MKKIILALIIIASFLGCNEDMKTAEELKAEKVVKIHKYFTPSTEYGVYDDDKSFQVVQDGETYIYIDVLTTSPIFSYNPETYSLNYGDIADMDIYIEDDVMTVVSDTVTYRAVLDVGIVQIFVDDVLDRSFGY